MSATLSRVGKFVSGHVNRALNWLNRPSASENDACGGLEMIPLNDFLMENYSSVSLEDLRARPASPRAASAAWACAWAWPLQLLAAPLRSPAVRRALAAEQRFLCRRVGARFRRVSWIGRASLFWGLLFTLVSSCGVILALSGDLGRMLEHPGMWFVQFSTYLMAYSTAIHVTQVICAILLLTAVQMSEASPPRVPDPTEAEVGQWFWSLGFPAPPAADPCHAPSTQSGSPTPAPLPAPSPGRTPAVLQVHAQIEHNPDGQRPRAYTRSTSSTHSLSPEAVKCGGSRLADSSFGSSPHAQGTTKRKVTTGSSPGRSKISQSLIEELCDEDTAEGGTRPSNDKRAQKTVPLRTPWLWTSVVTLATYTITAVTFYCSGSVVIPTTLCVILVLSTPCILDVLAEVLEVSEKTSDDLERLFVTGPSPESSAETSELASARSLEDALRDGSSPEFDEKKCSLQFRDLSSE